MKIHVFNRKMVLAILLVLLCAGTFCIYNSILKVKAVKNSYLYLSHATDISDPVKLMGISSNVFTGTVKKQMYTKERDAIPYTFFTVDVKENVKGTLKGEILVKQLGGIKNFVNYIAFEDTLLNVGCEYLFATRYDKDNDAYTVIPVYGDINLANQDSFKNSKPGFSNNITLLNDKFSNSADLVVIYKEALLRSTDFDATTINNAEEKLREDAKLNNTASKNS